MTVASHRNNLDLVRKWFKKKRNLILWAEGQIYSACCWIDSKLIEKIRFATQIIKQRFACKYSFTFCVKMEHFKVSGDCSRILTCTLILSLYQCTHQRENTGWPVNIYFEIAFWLLSFISNTSCLAHDIWNWKGAISQVE